MESIKETKLTALGVDCLERIFRYLPLDDLLNVADSNKQLKEVADLVFVLNHWNKCLAICLGIFRKKKFWLYSGDILSSDFKTILQLLRCFGQLMLKLKINVIEDLKKNVEMLKDINIDHIISYIKFYCVESLTELDMRAPAGIMNRFVKPFPNVHSVCVQSSDLPNLSLIELFPKMKCLTYRCDKITDFASIESNVRALDHLEIITISSSKEDGELFRSIGLNPKLQSLAIPFSAIYQGINEVHPHLTVLKVNNIRGVELSTIYNSVNFYFKTVKRLDILYREYFTRIPLAFDNLEQLDLMFMTPCPLKYHPENFYDFIAQNPSIIKLKISGDMMKINLSKLLNMLPVLREFDVEGRFLIHDVIRFINKKKTLKKMKVSNYFNEKDYAIIRMQLQLNEEWNLVPFGLRLIFKRK